MIKTPEIISYFAGHTYRSHNWENPPPRKWAIYSLAPAVQTFDIAIQWISITKTNWAIHWIVNYPVDNAIPGGDTLLQEAIGDVPLDGVAFSRLE